MTIRPALPEDLGRLQQIEDAADELFTELWRPEEWESAPSGADRAEMPGFILVAIDGDDAIGFVHVLEVGAAAHLEQLSVLPTFARRGHGRALVEAAASEAESRGHPELTLRTFADVPWNAPFYASCGFVESEPTTDLQHELVRTEHALGLDGYGRRIQMTRKLA